MDREIITAYCIIDDMLKANYHREDPQCQMSDAEVMTTAIVAMRYFGGNYTQARTLLGEQGYIPRMLGASRFSRRLHRIKHMFQDLFSLLGEYWKMENSEAVYSIDSFPVPVCDNIRIKRAKIYQDERYRGYCASKKRYFYGLKLHLLVSDAGNPVEMFFTPASTADVSTLPFYTLDLPPGSTVYADRGYNDYEFEDDLRDNEDILFLPMRKSNSKRPLPAWTRYLQHIYRKTVETTGSLITRLFPKSIHAVNALGFELKIFLFVLAFSLSRFMVAT